MIRELREFRHRPAAEKVLLLRAWWHLTLLWPRLGLGSLDRIWARIDQRARRRADARRADVPPPGTAAPAGPGTATPAGPGTPPLPPEQIDRVAWLVEVAGRYTLPPATCLTRALTTAWLLSGRGVGTRLQIGVRKDGTRLLAHAWLEHEGRAVTPVPAEGDFLPLAPAGPSGNSA